MEHQPAGTAVTIRSGEMRLAARVSGEAGAPTVVLVHGFPDTQAVWEPVAGRLVRDGLRVVTYDVRGAGRSTAPRSRAGYRVERLVDDLVAVLDRTAPDGVPVHLAGHDWGSVQLWEAVLGEADDARLRGRIASYTSISGPALQHFGNFLRSAASERRWKVLLTQLRRSWYIGAFQVPVLPEWVMHTFGDRIARRIERSQHLGPASHWGPSFTADAGHGVNLYRANARRGVKPSTLRRTTVPVQLVVPVRDAFLTPAIYDDLPDFVADLSRSDVDAGHWAPRTHPDTVADAVSTFVRAH